MYNRCKIMMVYVTNNVKTTYKVVSIDTQREKHVEKFQFDKSRVFEFLQ